MSDETTKLDTSEEMIAERRSGSVKMPDDMPKWMAALITKIDLFSKWTGNIVCWITVPLIPVSYTHLTLPTIYSV